MRSVSHNAEYAAPDMHIVELAVERGFSASWGEEGEAGDTFDINDNGLF